MLRGYRRFIVTAVGLATVGVSVGFGLLQQSGYQQEAEHRRTDYARHTANQIRQACVGIPAPKNAQCREDGANEYALKARDNQREYDDLVAQKTSALWTGVMGVAALLGMLLSAVGVLLVWTTFQETKRTNLIAMRENARSTRRALASGRESAVALAIAQRNADAAARQVEVVQDTAKRQLRAYVSASNAKQIGKLQIGAPFRASVEIANQGNTPAHDTIIRGTVIFTKDPTDIRGFRITPEDEDAFGTASTLGPGIKAGGFLESKGVTIEQYEAVQVGNLTIMCLGQITYRDVFGDQHSTNFRLERDKAGAFERAHNGNDAD